MAAVGAAFFFFLLCFFAFFGASATVIAAAGASTDIGAAVFGMSAAVAPAAMPSVKRAEVIKVPDFFIASPSGGYTRAPARIRRIDKIKPR